MPKPKSKGTKTPPKPRPDQPLRKGKAKKTRVLRVSAGADADGGEEVEAAQEAPLTNAGEQRILPAFLIRDGGEWRAAGFEADILARVPWEEADLGPLLHGELPDGNSVEPAEPAERMDGGEPDCAFAGLYLLDVIPDPRMGSEIARVVFDELARRHDPQRMEDQYVFILEAMHRGLRSEGDRLAQGVFRDLLEAKAIRFLMVVDSLPEVNPTIGGQYELALFDEPSVGEFQGFAETRVAFLESQEQLFRWYGERAPHESDLDPVFVVEADGQSLADWVRGDVFKRCAEVAEERRWSEMLPSLRSENTRLEMVDAEGWAARVGGLMGKAK